jgi:hypothetical protein
MSAYPCVLQALTVQHVRISCSACEKPSGQFLGLITMSHWLDEVWIRIRYISVVLLHLSCSYGESRLFVLWCAGGSCNMAGSDEDHGRSRRPGAENWGWSHRSGTRWPDDREVGWRCVWFTLCTWRREAWVSWLSLKTKVDGLSVVWPWNRWQRFVSGLASKPLGRFLLVWSKNRWCRVFRFGPQNYSYDLVI